MNLLLAFVCASFVLGLRATDASEQTRLRLVMAGAFVLGFGYLSLRFI